MAEYPSINDNDVNLLKKIVINTADLSTAEAGDVSSVAGTANQVLVNGGTTPKSGAVTLSLIASFTGASTYAGTAGQTYTFPTTTATIARTDASQTFTGTQTFAATGIIIGADVALSRGAANRLDLGDITVANTFRINSNNISTLSLYDGGGSPREFTLDVSGNSFHINDVTSGTVPLTIAPVTGNVTFAGAAVYFQDGADTTPSIGWASGTTTGFYKPSSGAIGVSGNLLLRDGGNGTPSLAFVSGGTTGLYRAGSSNLGISAGTLTVSDTLAISPITTASGKVTFNGTLDASALGTASVVLSGGLSVAKKIVFGTSGSFLDGTTGSIGLTATGTNQSITLTPSGTGGVVVPWSSFVNNYSAARYLGLSRTDTANTGPVLVLNGGNGSAMQFGPSGSSGAYLDIGGNATAAQNFFSIRLANGASSYSLGTVARFESNAHLLLGGLTTDGTGVLQFPAATTSAGGIAFGTTNFIYAGAANQINVDVGAATPMVFDKNSTVPRIFVTGDVLLQSNASATGVNGIRFNNQGTDIASVNANGVILAGTKTVKFGTTSAATIGVSADTTAGILQLTAPSAGNVQVASGVATPASGSAAAALLFGTTAGFGIYYGSGAPTVSAAKGSIYLRSDGTGIADRMYVNTNGTTGWTNFVTAA